jgi:hypothetical protein
MDMAGVDALTRCKKDTFPNFAPWTNEGAGQRDLPTGEGLLYAFIRNNREPLEQELELDYLCSLMFTDTARFASIVVYAGMHAGGALFLGPLGPVQTAANFLIGGIVSLFDEGKRIRYLEKLAKASPLFEASETSLSGNLEQVEDTTATFTFPLKLKLKRPIKL